MGLLERIQANPRVDPEKTRGDACFIVGCTSPRDDPHSGFCQAHSIVMRRPRPGDTPLAVTVAMQVLTALVNDHPSEQVRVQAATLYHQLIRAGQAH
jgi:hypothetical protein